ncbi:MAG: hypothetical protein AB1782_06565 [Cyanobacteriota bacterium]
MSRPEAVKIKIDDHHLIYKTSFLVTFGSILGIIIFLLLCGTYASYIYYAADQRTLTGFLDEISLIGAIVLIVFLVIPIIIFTTLSTTTWLFDKDNKALIVTKKKVFLRLRSVKKYNFQDIERVWWGEKDTNKDLIRSYYPLYVKFKQKEEPEKLFELDLIDECEKVVEEIRQFIELQTQ